MTAPRAGVHAVAGGPVTFAPDEGVVALLTPTGRDATLATRVLGRSGLRLLACQDMAALCAAIREHVGAVVLAEEALVPAARAQLLETLAAQPPWSDIPVVILTGNGELSRAIPPGLQVVLTAANATLLERPVRVATLVTALRSALRARRRQLDLREDLATRARVEQALRDSEARLRDAVEREAAARLEAERANRAKSDFLAAMSHELRTPLNAIGGYAQLLALGVRGPMTEGQRADLLRIDHNQRHLLSLINDILNFAKIEAGHVSFELQPVELRALIGGLEPLVAPQLAGKQLAYHDTSDSCDAVVRADEDKARQIMLNLLSNAIKFTPPGGSISIDCTTDDAFAHVSVTDDGAGVPADKRAVIFEPFVQLERTFSSPHEGTGLGLAISRDLARRMGGDLQIVDGPARGACFRLSLPMYRDD